MNDKEKWHTIQEKLLTSVCEKLAVRALTDDSFLSILTASMVGITTIALAKNISDEGSLKGIKKISEIFAKRAGLRYTDSLAEAEEWLE